MFWLGRVLLLLLLLLKPQRSHETVNVVSFGLDAASWERRSIVTRINGSVRRRTLTPDSKSMSDLLIRQENNAKLWSNAEHARHASTEKGTHALCSVNMHGTVTNSGVS
jgi:hypothetical protein